MLTPADKLALSSPTEVTDPLPFTINKQQKKTNYDTKHLLQKHIVGTAPKPPP